MFKSVIVHHPAYAPTYNNPAQVEFEPGNPALAESSARFAMALGGEYLATYRETLQTIIKSKGVGVIAVPFIKRLILKMLVISPHADE